MQTNLRWVKGTEKLPPMEKVLFLKLDGETMGLGNFYEEDQAYMLHVQRNGAHEEYDKPWFSKMNVEWLEETPSAHSPLPEGGNWIRVEDRLPELTEPLTMYDDDLQKRVTIKENYKATVLGYHPDRGIFKAEYTHRWAKISTNSTDSTVTPTHWMLLPQPPGSSLPANQNPVKQQEWNDSDIDAAYFAGFLAVPQLPTDEDKTPTMTALGKELKRLEGLGVTPAALIAKLRNKTLSPLSASNVDQAADTGDAIGFGEFIGQNKYRWLLSTQKWTNPNDDLITTPELYQLYLTTKK